MPVNIVANRLGQTDPATTLSIYIDALLGDDRVAADALARVLLAPGKASEGAPDEGSSLGHRSRSRRVAPCVARSRARLSAHSHIYSSS